MIGLLLLQVLKGAVMGAAIGWATNRLAVWMLFNPKRPIRIGPWRVPLTPGLVVKNKTRLAEAVGRSIARDLLDSHTIVTELKRIDLGSLAADWMIKERDRLALSGDAPLKALGLDESQSEKVVAEVTRLAGGAISDSLPRLAAAVAPGLEDWIRAELATGTPQSLLGDAARARAEALLTSAVREGLPRLLSGERLNSLLKSAIAGLPETAAWQNLEAKARDYAGERIPELTIGFQESLAGYLSGEEFSAAVRPRLAGRLHTAIVDKYPMARMLVSEKSIAELLEKNWPSLAEELATLARGESLGTFLQGQLTKGADQILGSLAGAVTAPGTADGLADWAARSLADLPIETAAREWLDGVWQKPLSALIPPESLPAGALVDQLTRVTDRLVQSEGFRRSLDRAVAAMLRRALIETPAAQLLAGADETRIREIGRLIGGVIETQAERQLPTLLGERFRIDELVARKIEDFEAHKLESTINKVSGRELTGIVRLGGLIGLVVGAGSEVIFWLMAK